MKLIKNATDIITTIPACIVLAAIVVILALGIIYGTIEKRFLNES